MEATGASSIRRFAAAALISTLGTDAAAVAFGFYLYARTHSAIWLSAWWFLSFGIGGVLTPVGGWLADRLDRQRLLIAVNFGGAVCSTILVVLRAPGGMLAVSFVAAVIGRGYGPAANAAVPNLAGDQPLEKVNGTMGVAFNVGRLIGPVVGGVMFAILGRPWVFGLDAASFLVGAVLIATIRGPFRAPGEVHDEEADRGVLAGFRRVLVDPALRALLLVWAALYFAVDIVLVGELPLTRALGAGAVAFGILDAAWGCGSVVGSLLGRRLPRRWDPHAILLGAVGVVVGYMVIAVSPWFALVVLGMAIVATCDGAGTVAGFAFVQRRAADQVRGRVFAAYSTAGMVANAIAFAIAGFIVDAIGPRGIFVLGAAVAAISAPFLAPVFREERVPRTHGKGEPDEK
jgi:MFS family permease